jgi:hypothetical protein
MTNLTPTQKKILELPLFLLLLWILQSLELSLLQLPFSAGIPQIVTFIIAYIAFTRGWKTTTTLSFVIAFLGASNVAYSAGIFIAAHMWAALITKVVIAALALEGRRSFVSLMLGFHLVCNVLTLGLLHFSGAGPTLPSFFTQYILQVFYVAVMAYLLFPAFILWDDFFEHAYDEDSSLTQSPGF